MTANPEDRMSQLGDLIVEHGPITNDNFDWDLAHRLYEHDPADINALRDELIELRALREQGEPEWHRGCTWCWRTAWHPPEADQ